MAAQLFHLRLLVPVRSSFTSHLQTLAPSSKPLFSLRRFSGRPSRSRDHGRTGFRPERSSAGANGREKSLIEDEAELSDWVSDLKTDSLRLGLSDDDDSGPARTKSSTGRAPRSKSSGGFPERSLRGSFSKKRYDSDLDEEKESKRVVYGKRSDGRGSKGRFDSDSGLMRGSEGRFDSDSGLMKRGGRDSKGRFDSDSGLTKRGGRDSKGRFDSDLGLMKRKGRDAESTYRKGQTKTSLVLDSPEEEEDDGNSGLMKRGGRDSKGKFDSDLGLMKREGRDAESTYRKGQMKKSLVLDSSEEEDDGMDDDYHDEDDDDEDDGDGGVMSGVEDDYFGSKIDRKKARMDGSLQNVDSEKTASRSSGGDKYSYLSETRFDQCTISSLTLKGIKAAGYERMTLVQEATLPVILKGKDVLAKARTGTGKTVAFLLPAIEIVSKLPPVDRDQRKPAINVLVICPTRELADQAATEANTLLKFHPCIGVQVVIGGTRLALEQKLMQANPCQILVATPGRLRDHIENTPGFATRLMGVKVLVLDEADRLLDMGFRKDIEKIVAAVPKQRQTLLFSATVPDEVRQICYIAMKRDHEYVNTVEEGSEETHSQVRQMHLVAPLEKQFSILYGLLTEHISEDVDYKVIVFCTTAMMTKLVADLLAELRLNVREIHSRKPQSYRTRVSKEFKESKGLILVSSDVSARGVDYPDVTLVVQVGVPADREQYIHRLGRTGRKGKEGKGILMLAPWEEFFFSSIKDLPITDAPKPLVDPDTIKKVERALGHVEMRSKESAYQAWLGYYNSNKNVGRDKYKLVLLANEFSRSMGLDDPPAIAQTVLRKMGLNNVPGLRAK